MRQSVVLQLEGTVWPEGATHVGLGAVVDWRRWRAKTGCRMQCGGEGGMGGSHVSTSPHRRRQHSPAMSAIAATELRHTTMHLTAVHNSFTHHTHPGLAIEMGVE